MNILLQRIFLENLADEKCEEYPASKKSELNFFNDPKRILRQYIPPIILDLLKKWK